MCSTFVQTMTGFLIYDWIEQPKKQEIIQEVLKLLEQKVLEPHSGVWQCIAFALACHPGLNMICCATICLQYIGVGHSLGFWSVNCICIALILPAASCLVALCSTMMHLYTGLVHLPHCLAQHSTLFFLVEAWHVCDPSPNMRAQGALTSLRR